MWVLGFERAKRAPATATWTQPVRAAQLEAARTALKLRHFLGAVFQDTKRLADQCRCMARCKIRGSQGKKTQSQRRAGMPPGEIRQKCNLALNALMAIDEPGQQLDLPRIEV